MLIVNKKKTIVVLLKCLQMPKEKTGEPDPKQTLAEYCKKRGFSSPKYSTVPTKSKKFEGIVQVEGNVSRNIILSSY